MRSLILSLLLTILFASVSTAAEPKTPNEFLARGMPTFVAGTPGDDESDRKILAQIDLIRGMLFPESKVILDTEIQLAQGPGSWPKNPILYGGPHVNRVVAALAGRLPFDPREGGPLESLVAHEGTHIIAYHAWGPAGTPLFAEGLAVWVAGSYGGMNLAVWLKRLSPIGRSPSELLGPMFRRLPGSLTSPVAGILTGALIRKVGLAKFREHLYPATPETWDKACQAAGITPAEVEKLLR